MFFIHTVQTNLDIKLAQYIVSFEDNFIISPTLTPSKFERKITQIYWPIAHTTLQRPFKLYLLFY